MLIRKVNSTDEAQIFDLSNDQDVRQSSFKSEKISYSDHQCWFRERLADDNTCFLIAHENDQLVGQVRFHITESEAVISISIASAFRGKGHGVPIMKKAIAFCKQEHSISSVKAYIKADNLKSKKYFEACGYQLREQILHHGITTDIYVLETT